jgi:hypothetical protein
MAMGELELSLKPGTVSASGAFEFKGDAKVVTDVTCFKKERDDPLKKI